VLMFAKPLPMDEYSGFNKKSFRPKNYDKADHSPRKNGQKGLSWLLALSGPEQGRGLLIMLILVASAALLTLLPLALDRQMPPLATFSLWLSFGGLSIWLGSRLNQFLSSRSETYKTLMAAHNQAVREITEPELLLDHISHTLYTTLALDRLSIWRYHDEERVLTLSRFQGKPAGEQLAELPVDTALEQLLNTQPVSNLPESALRRGLISSGVQVVTTLRVGGEVIGLIGLGAGKTDLQAKAENLTWLDLMAGQLALALKNAYLVTDLEETLNKLQLAYRRTIDAQDEERRSLAVELHDDILSRLTTMAISLRSVQKYVATDPDQVQQWLEDLEKETQNLNRRLREVTQGLHPSVLADLGLIAALQAYSDSLTRQPLPASAPQSITFTAQGFNGDRLTNQKLERDLYFVTRQALDNALKHAQADRVFIHLRWGEAAISATVQDTGQGMKNSPEVLMGQDGHLGLLSMNERVLAWQGRLSFDTAAERGTTIHIRIPVEQGSSEPTHLQTFTQYLRK